MKIVIIGGGSSYTPELIDGLIKKGKSLRVEEIVLVDIKEGSEKLQIIEDLARRMIAQARLKVRLSATFNRQEALKDADFIITQIRVGGLAARARDERIPLKYNLIGQETTGAGGFAKALRTVPVILDICQDIAEYSKDNAWLINFTNPAGIISEVINKYSTVNVIGLCNVPYNMGIDIARMMSVDTEQVYIEFAGLNHLVFGKKVLIDGIDRTAEVLEKLIKGDSNSMKNIPDMGWDPVLLKSIQMIPCPYHRYFYMTEELLAEEKEGRVRAEEVMEIEKDLFEIYQDQGLKEKPQELIERGGAYYSEVAIGLIDAIVNNRNEIHTINLLNQGAISNLEDDVAVEINAIVGRDGIKPIMVGKLPDEVLGLVRSIKNYEKLTIEAAVNGDRKKALMALYTNPLVNSVEKAKGLLSDILKENREYLPQFEQNR